MLYSYLQRGAFTCREAGKLAVLYWVLCYEAKFARGRVVSRRAAPALASSLRALALSRGRARAARGSDAPGAGARGLRYRIELAHKIITPLSFYTHRELLEWGLLWGACVRALPLGVRCPRMADASDLCSHRWTDIYAVAAVLCE